MQPPVFGFIGAGRMATALARGFVEAGLAKAEQIVASDPSAAAAEAFKLQTGGRVFQSNAEVLAGSSVAFLAVKPQQMADVLSELKDKAADRLVVSIAAGAPLATLAAGLGRGVRLVRVMPNTPCLVGQGASAYSLGPGATPDDGQLVGKLLSSVGKAWQVDEKLLDAVTGLSGSGPAFVYLFIEALADGGVRSGLPRDVALGLAAQTVAGAAQLVLTSGQHPGVLKDQVTSPGGTTIAGLAELERGAVRGDVIAAVEAATRRATQLGQS